LCEPKNTLRICCLPIKKHNTVEPGHNDIGLCDVSSVASDIVWYRLIPHC
jgi:hypothetical protein